jgi:hypothetical protein
MATAAVVTEDPATARANVGRRSLAGRSWLWFTLLAIAAAALHLVRMSGTTFYVDEWNAIFQYNWSPGSLLTPVNGHNAVTGRLSWYAVMALFGISDYLPYRILGFLFNLFTAAALFHYARVRHSVLAGICLAAISFGLGSSFHTILWPASAIGVLSMGALPLCLLLLARNDLRSNAFAVGLLFVTLGVGAMGLVVLGACFVELVLRKRGRQLLVLVVPVVLYALWLLRFGGGSSSGTSFRALLDAPAYVQNAFAFAAAGLMGLPPSLAATAATLYLAGLGWACYRNRRQLDWRRMCSLGSAALAFWVLTAAFRGSLGEAGAPRYIAFGALPLGLLVVEATMGMPISRPTRVAVVVLTAVSLVPNIAMLLIAETNFRYIGEIQRAQLSALELVRPTVDSGYLVPGEWARYVHAGDYFRAVDRFGSPALPHDQLSEATPSARAAADEVLVGGRAVVAQPSASAVPAGSTCAPSGGSLRLDPGQQVVVRTLTNPVGVRLQQLADGPPDAAGFTLPAASINRVRASLDGVPRPWHLYLSGPAEVCVP